jgi:hypothetical protein
MIQRIALQRFSDMYPRRLFRRNPSPVYNVFVWAACDIPIHTFGPYETIWETLHYTAEVVPWFKVNPELFETITPSKVAHVSRTADLTKCLYLVNTINRGSPKIKWRP